MREVDVFTSRPSTIFERINDFIRFFSHSALSTQSTEVVSCFHWSCSFFNNKTKLQRSEAAKLCFAALHWPCADLFLDFLASGLLLQTRNWDHNKYTVIWLISGGWCFTNTYKSLPALKDAKSILRPVWLVDCFIPNPIGFNDKLFLT